MPNINFFYISEDSCDLQGAGTHWDLGSHPFSHLNHGGSQIALDYTRVLYRSRSRVPNLLSSLERKTPGFFKHRCLLQLPCAHGQKFKAYTKSSSVIPKNTNAL